MKVILSISPADGAVTLEKEDDIAHGMGLYPPLGILYLSSYIRENSHHEVKIIDGDAECLTNEELINQVTKEKPDVFGITTFTTTLLNILEIIEGVKKNNPNCIIVLGGPHIPLFPKETINQPYVDYAIVGDGEDSFLKLLNLLENKDSYSSFEEDLKKIEGILFKTADNSIFQNGYARVLNLNELPYPARDLLNQERYYCILGKKKIMTTIATSRGCPFSCTFCNSPDKKYRERTPENVVDEMEHVANSGINEIFFFDDLFNITEKRVLATCNEIIRRGLHKRVSWAFRGRVNSLTSDEVVKKLKEAGCERVQLGLEKATDESLKKIKKGTKVWQIEKAVELLHKHKIISVGNFVFFTPGEGIKEAEEILKFSLKLKLDHCQYHVFAPYPGSEIYEEGLKSKFFKRDYWREYAIAPERDFSVLWEEKVSKEQMYEFASKAYKRFYFRPRIIVNEVKKLSSWSELARKARGALTLLDN